MAEGSNKSADLAHLDHLDSAIDRSAASEIREKCRSGEHTTHTSGYAPGFVQANLVVLPQKYAYDFLVFCQRNPKPCPLIEVTDPGSIEARIVAPGSDIRNDFPKYVVWENGEAKETPQSLEHVWREDLVTFLLGCSFSFEHDLLAQGFKLRHLEEKNEDGKPKNVSMYKTGIPCRSAGVFSGPLVVSMRPFKREDVPKVIEITAQYPAVHGAPVHWGDPSKIGIQDINKPDYGDAVTIHEGEVPVFWACGVTPQAVIAESKVDFVATHAPGYMLVCDKLDSEFKVTDPKLSDKYH